MVDDLFTTLYNIIEVLFLIHICVFHLYLLLDGQIRPQDQIMALDWSIGLHAICVRGELDIKTAA
jgi:hypothetical protein